MYQCYHRQPQKRNQNVNIIEANERYPQNYCCLFFCLISWLTNKTGRSIQATFIQTQKHKTGKWQQHIWCTWTERKTRKMLVVKEDCIPRARLRQRIGTTVSVVIAKREFPNTTLNISHVIDAEEQKASVEDWNLRLWLIYYSVLICMDACYLVATQSFFFSNLDFAADWGLYGLALYADIWTSAKKTISTQTRIFCKASFMCSTSNQACSDLIMPTAASISRTIPWKRKPWFKLFQLKAWNISFNNRQPQCFHWK